MLILASDSRKCPFKQQRYIDSYGDERSFSNRDCETTNCMAWRWYDKPNANVRRGYCGLAGLPQQEA